MKKTNIHKLLYAISILLVLGFAVSFGIDACNYNDYMGSAPLYVYAIVRAVEFIPLSIIVFIVALIIRKKFKD
ncbi:MAG: hypothetical protein IJ370_07685 [Oscillospiraceae bacterium]|nr:hypothetical protein [Oscillospiraceae bacterium]